MKARTRPTELSTSYRDFNDLHAEALGLVEPRAPLAELLDHMEAIAKAARLRWGIE